MVMTVTQILIAHVFCSIAFRPDEFYDEETECRYTWMRKFAWECDPWFSLPHGTLTSVSEFLVM
jgi:hypothetical protein